MEVHCKYKSFSGQPFSSTEALKGHQVKMTNTSHICSTWFCPIAFSLRARSQRNTQWESVHEFPEGKAAHQEEVLELRCQKPYICPFHHGEPQDSIAL